MIRDQLCDVSPYDGFDPEPHPDDVQGWGSDDPLLIEAIRTLRPKLICEVGSWKGRSAINMAKEVKNLGLSTEIVCVDTWLGSPEHWLRKDAPEYYGSLRITEGFPQLYYTFLANVVRAGMEEIITPLPNTSDNAAIILQKLGARFDMVYIDGAHEYEAAKRDIENYYNLLADNALLIGDDYMIWDGPTRAANELAKQHRIPIIGRWGKFIMSKGTAQASIAMTV